MTDPEIFWSSTTALTPRGRRRWTTTAFAAIGVALSLAVVACGDDGESAQDRYCDAGAELQESVGALVEVDLIGGGVDGVTEAVDAVRSDVGAVRDAAEDAAAADIDELAAAVDDVESALDALGDDLDLQNATALGEALGRVDSALGAVVDTLADCD